MRIITESAIDVSESLASYILSSYIYQATGNDVTLEKRMNYVNTGQFSRADLYYSDKDMGIETKSIAHGVECLKGVLQASIYKEQVENGAFCMQRPRRKALRESLESMCEQYGVGLVYIEGIPSICGEDSIIKATGGCAKPFELWKDSTFTSTRHKIVANSRSDWSTEYIETLDKVIYEYSDKIFNFKIDPKPEYPGLSKIHDSSSYKQTNATVGEFC